MREAKHVVDGVKYVEVARKAEVGEKVIIVNKLYDYRNVDVGSIFTVTDFSEDCGWGGQSNLHGIEVSEVEVVFLEAEYRVLEPATSQSSQEERIAAVCDEVKALLIRKNRDYGDSFAKQYAKYGVLSGLIRMDDKISRIDNLVSGAEDSVGESLADSMLDLSGYSILTLVEMRKADAEKTGVK